MNASDPGRDHAAAELSRLLPTSVERDFRPGRQQSLKEHLMSEIRTERETGRVRARRPRRRAMAAGGVVAAAAVAALVTIAVTGPGNMPRPPHAAAPQAAAPVTAAHLLAQVAAAAARQEGPAGSGQFWYIQTELAQVPANSAVLPKPHERQEWLSVKGACVPGEINDPTFGFDHQPLGNADQSGPCPKPSFATPPTEAWLESLPTDPHTLLNMLSAATSGYAGAAKDHAEFTAIGDLFDGAIVPPQVSAGLFRAAALIPGVTADQHVTDVLGHPALAVGFTGGGARDEWLFNPRTLRYVGERSINISTGQVGGSSAIAVQAFVDHVGEVPPGS
jgi:hypothetical protein